MSLRIVALNRERAAEEARGEIRWLRPEFQNPGQPPVASAESPAKPHETAIRRTDAAEAAPDGDSSDGTSPIAIPRAPWPNTLPEQMAAVARLLAESPQPLGEDAIAARFSGKGPWKKRLPQIIETLIALGRARRGETGEISGG